MFTLIIAIIAGVLVAALVIAAIYYGGTDFDNNEAIAQAAAYQAQGNQLAGAIAIYEGSHQDDLPPTMSALVVDNYLTVIPPGGWAISGDFVTQDGVSQADCQEADTAEGLSAIPICTNATPTTPCCAQ